MRQKNQKISWATASRLTKKLRGVGRDCIELDALATGLNRRDLRCLCTRAEQEFERIAERRWRAEKAILRRGTFGDKMRVLARRARDGLDISAYLTDPTIIPLS